MKRYCWIGICLCLLLFCASRHSSGRENTWVEIVSPNFTVFSDAGEKKARRVTHEFEKFRSVLRSFLPSLKADPGIPTVVLAANDEGTMKTLLPMYWEEKGRARPAGVFVGGPERNYIVLRLNLEDDLRYMADDFRYMADDFRYHAVYHEYVHLLMRLNYPPLPVWLNEGLAECFGYTLITDDSSIVGRPSPMLLTILRNEVLLPIEELFRVDQSSPQYREESKASIFYAQSWALTHMLLLGDKREHAPTLLKYLELIRNNIPAEEASVQAFGDLKELESRLNDYIQYMAFYAFEVKTPSVGDPEEYLARTMSPLEVYTMEGDFFISMQMWSEARDMFDSVLAADPQNAEALSGMGAFHLRQNHWGEAAGYFAEAVRAGSKSCITHYYMGITAMHSGDYDNAEAGFRRAIDLNPRFAPAYSSLAGILAMREETTPDALKLVVKAISLEPGMLNHQMVLANVLMRLNEMDMAIRHAERVEAAADSDNIREEARRFLATARRYRDNAAEIEQMKSAIGKRPSVATTPRNSGDSGIDQDEARRKKREAMERAFEEAEREEQSLLKEKTDAYEGRNKLEREYQQDVADAKDGGTASVEALVTEVQCFDPAGMELTVEKAGNRFRLHIADYYEISFKGKDHTPEGELKPCTDLAGKRVDLKFIPTPGAAYDGEVQSVEIYKK